MANVDAWVDRWLAPSVLDGKDAVSSGHVERNNAENSSVVWDMKRTTARNPKFLSLDRTALKSLKPGREIGFSLLCRGSVYAEDLCMCVLLHAKKWNGERRLLWRAPEITRSFEPSVFLVEAAFLEERMRRSRKSEEKQFSLKEG